MFVGKKNICGYWSGSTNDRSDESSSDDEKQAIDAIYYELHQKISSRSFNSRVAQTLTLLSDAVSNVCFLDVSSIAKCGAAGMGTVINSCCDAKLVIYVHNLPQGTNEKNDIKMKRHKSIKNKQIYIQHIIYFCNFASLIFFIFHFFSF